MKKFKSIVLISIFLVLINNIVSAVILGPAMGMMQSHSLVSTNPAYQGLMNNDKTLSYDNLAVAIATSEKYEYSGHSESSLSDWLYWVVDGAFYNEDDFSILIDADELMFISDDNPVYKRPFRLYTLQRGVKRDQGAYKYRVNVSYEVDIEKTREIENTARGIIRSIDDVKIGEPEKFPKDNDGTEGGTYYRWVWRDICLQLPGSPVSGGVEVDGVFYPLIQGNYSARFEVTFTNNVTGESATLPVIIPGYYNASGVAPDTTAAFSITPDPSAVNLNIEQLVRNRNLQKVGSLDFLWREKDFSSSSQLDDGAGTFIFLSASPDPFTLAPDGFKLVHEDFVEGETAYSDTNSIDYYVVLSGNSDHVGIGENFYGDDYYPTGSRQATKWIRTQCHKQAQPQQSGYAHYHTYTGDISIRVEGTPDVTLLAKGQYSSTIYVHVVAEDTI